MKSKILDFSIKAFFVLLIPFAMMAGNWFYYDHPQFYTEVVKNKVSFEEIKEPQPNKHYYHQYTKFMVSKRSFFPIVISDTVRVADNGYTAED